jgi:transcriptional regulator with XRE-family HTH domain
MLTAVTPKQIGRIARALRHRRGLTQSQVGALAGTSRGPVQRLEDGGLEGMLFGRAARVFEVLDARLDCVANWHGAALDRLLDEAHAAVVAGITSRLRRSGWEFVLYV